MSFHSPPTHQAFQTHISNPKQATVEEHNDPQHHEKDPECSQANPDFCKGIQP
jgi:hypothetical protein